MSWVNFDEVLLDVFYTNFAAGGPEFNTALIDTIAGLEQARVNRLDYISRYVIDYGELENQRRKDLRTFHLLRFGMAYGFRFLAPDDADDDGKGILVNSAGAQVSSVTSGVTYYLAKKYTDAGRTYIRRIIKPVGGAFGAAPQLKLAGVNAASTTNTTNGQIVPGATGATPTWTGTFHLPVRFTTDFNEMKTDETAISEWPGVGIRELLPIALGITA